MTRLTELLNKNFKELTNKELTELKVLLAQNDIDVEELDELSFETIKIIFKEEENMMNETMNNTAATVEVEEVTMGEKAKAFAEASKEKLTEGFEYIVNNVSEVKEEVVKMANMPSDKLEDYLKDSGKDVLNNIINAVKKYSKSMKDSAGFFPSLKDDAVKADNIIDLIKDVLDEEELNGWGKFKAIVKAVALWLVKLLLKVGAFILKLAFTLVVGAVKIGATALVTTGKALDIVNKDVIKPVIKTGKKAFKSAKEKLVKDDADLDDIEEMLFEDYAI